MTDPVTWENHDGVALISIDNPPVNALSQAVRRGLLAAIDAAEADPAILGLVIRSTGRNFSAGADIREFGKATLAPTLPDLCNRVEACTKPVVTALHGKALGGGFELALSAHARVALSSASLGLPEVTLGLLPGAGGTQRVPRLAGAEVALRLILSGRPMRAADAQARGLLDVVVEDGLNGSAIALVRQFALDGHAPLPTRDRLTGLRDPIPYSQAIAEARRGLNAPHLPAPARIIDCIEAALLLPFEAGLAYERAAFEECLASEAAQGLRHVFLSERRAAHYPESAAQPRPVGEVGVVGGGPIGTDIAATLLHSGLSVTLIERDTEMLLAGIKRIAALQDAAIAKGRLTSAQRDAEWERLNGFAELSALATADLVIETTPEDEALKTALFRDLDAVLKPGAVLASNASYLDPDALAQATSRAPDVIGMHFFPPARSMKLIEVVPGVQTAPEVTATGFALARRLGKIAVRAGVCDGFIGNRVLTAYRDACDLMLEDGASPAQIDAAMRDFGMALGPYEAADMAGLDMAWSRRKRLAAQRDPARRHVTIADRLCEAGRFGQKTRAGYYLYPEGHAAQQDPAVLSLIAAERAAKGITPRAFPMQEIQFRALSAMANEGARIVAEGIALRPSDVDVVMILGMGFPRWRGGPMKWADLQGLLELRKAILAFAPQDPAFWVPSELLSELIKNGRNFDDLNSSSG